jgi:hypothetical protein
MMGTPAYSVVPDIRGPLISALLQFYTGADGSAEGDPVSIPEGLAFLALIDLIWVFLQYVRETEREHGGDFPGFLQRAARGAYSVAPYEPDDDPDEA